MSCGCHPVQVLKGLRILKSNFVACRSTRGNSDKGFLSALCLPLASTAGYALCHMSDKFAGILLSIIYFIKYGLCEVAVGRKMTPDANQASQPSLHKIYWMHWLCSQANRLGPPLRSHSGKNVLRHCDRVLYVHLYAAPRELPSSSTSGAVALRPVASHLDAVRGKGYAEH